MPRTLTSPLRMFLIGLCFAAAVNIIWHIFYDLDDIGGPDPNDVAARFLFSFNLPGIPAMYFIVPYVLGFPGPGGDPGPTGWDRLAHACFIVSSVISWGLLLAFLAYLLRSLQRIHRAWPGFRSAFISPTQPPTHPPKPTTNPENGP